jgi:hypothetical protein
MKPETRIEGTNMRSSNEAFMGGDKSEAEATVTQLAQPGFDAKKPWMAGSDHRIDERAGGCLNAVDHFIYWGKMGGFRGGIWGLCSGFAFLLVPGIRSSAVMGQAGGRILLALESAVLICGLIAIVTELQRLRIARNGILRYATVGRDVLLLSMAAAFVMLAVPIANGQNPPPAAIPPNNQPAIPNTGTVAPGTGTVIPHTDAGSPNAGAVAPNVGTVIPNTGSVAPGTGTVIPHTDAGSPNAGASAPNVGTVIPNTGSVGPNRKPVIPNAGAAAPNSGTVIPNTGAPVPYHGSGSAGPISAPNGTPNSGPQALQRIPSYSSSTNGYGTLNGNLVTPVTNGSGSLINR